ncbi:MAG: hypothetical protein WCK01_01430 [Candidatus Uhrbacteria bacterium]
MSTSKSVRVTSVTKSVHCCEEGPIVLTEKDWQGIQVLSGNSEYFHPYGWSLDYPSVAALEEGHQDRLKRMLEDVQTKWQNGPDPFAYIGGNYDIAGTIALERWYARVFNDPSFHGLSDSLMAYLHGQNAYRVDFTHVSTIYHPCGTWWGFCDLRDTLVNGVDESRIFNTKRADRWRIEEIQLFGQAKYVLARVLYEGL